MKARFGAWLEKLGDQFWLRPAIVVLLSIALAEAAVAFDRMSLSASDPASSAWGYSGGAEGARILLGAVASSTIGVAGTIFSITIAALSLASGQMGPRLLRNFVRDSRNQIALGIFLGTFAYALMVLRTVRTAQETPFVPHLAVTGAVGLALACLGTLVWFVHHIAGSINVEKVVDAVHRDLCDAIDRGTLTDADLQLPAEPLDGMPVSVKASNYLLALDREALADWAHEHAVAVRLKVRPGDYVPLGAPVAVISADVEGAAEVFERTLTFGHRPAALQDLEYSIRQLSEVAVRALSPGINDPFTAGSVLERFGDALCRIAPRFLPTGAVARGGRIVLVYPVPTYRGLCDAMFHMIRQNGAGSGYVLIRLLEVIGRVAEVERFTTRCDELRRHADLALDAGRKGVTDAAALADIEDRHRRVLAAMARRSLPRQPRRAGST